MKVFEVIDRKVTEGRKVLRMRWVVTNKGTAEEPNVRARWVAQKFVWMDGPDSRRVLRHVTVFGIGKDYAVAVVDKTVEDDQQAM